MKKTTLALIIALLSICAFLFPAIPQKTQTLPYVSLIGANSYIKSNEYVLVSNQNKWAALWQRHLGKKKSEHYNFYYNPDALPVVDFKQCLVVAVFQGTRWNSAGVTACSLQETADAMVLRFDDKSYQTEGPDGGGEKCTAFGFFVIPKTAKTIVLEENTQGLIGGPPQWKERARLKP